MLGENETVGKFSGYLNSSENPGNQRGNVNDSLETWVITITERASGGGSNR